MRKVHVRIIRDTVRDLCISANIELRKDIKDALKMALKAETNKRAKGILNVLLKNADIAKREKLAICQDTGLCVVDIALGQGVCLIGGDLIKAVNDGGEEGY